MVWASTAKQGDYVFAVGTALAVHVFIFLFLVLLALAEILIESVREKEVPPKPEPKPVKEVIVELSPNILMDMRAAAIPLSPSAASSEVEIPPVLPEPEALPVKEEVILLEERDPEFMKTAEQQASETAPANPAFIGERDTVAGSELAPSDTGPAVPNQEGEEQKRNELNLFNSKFSDGDNPGDEPTNKQQPEKLAGDPTEESIGSQASTESEEIAVEESGVPKDPLLTNNNVVPVPEEEGKRAEMKEETLPKESKNQKEAEAAKKGEQGTAEKPPKEQPKKSGFRTEAKKTRMEGTINRRGENSLDVENTPVGRYKAQINRLIEREWQRQCVTHRNHILPGILTLRFYLDARGRTSGMRFVDEFHASEIQKGFTIQSVRSPKFPAMPKEVARELDGEPLEFRLNFNF